MSSDLTIRQARLVLPDRVVTGDLIVEDGVISEIGPHLARSAGEEINGTGLTCLPGAIDAHVNFRDPSPNLTEDFASGSRAAAAGGVTAFLDAPSNDPPCTTVERLEAKLEAAAPAHVDSVRRHIFDQLDDGQIEALGAIFSSIADGLHREPARVG